MWDELVARSSFPHPCLRSAYLDIVSPGWSAVSTVGMQSAMPVFLKRKWGIRYASMPAFIQQTGCLSEFPVSADPFILAVAKYSQLVEISVNETDILTIPHVMRSNYCLDMSADYQSIRANYNENTKRNITKASANGLRARICTDSARAMLFFARYNDKNNLSKNHLQLLQLLITSEINSLCKCIEIVDNEDTIHAIAVFAEYMNRHVYLAATLSISGREKGAMFGLIDAYIQQYCGSNGSLLDFEGSNIAGIARFYSGFGAVDRPYPFVRINRLPWILKYLKR